MTKLEFSAGNAQWFVPPQGQLLRVRHRLTGRQAIDFVFCDYGKRSEQALQLTGCRIKAVLFQHQVACDYALKTGLTTIHCEQVLEILQMPIPGWFHRRECDAESLAGKLSECSQAARLHHLFTTGLSPA